MAGEDKRPTKRIAKRAAELWKQMLRNPKFDNLGNTGTPEERRPNEMASILTTMNHANSRPGEDVIAAFGDELEKRLLDPETSAHDLYCLSVDYHPEGLLAECAEAVGLKSDFPWKTQMWLRENCVELSYGHAADVICHYPLSGDRWLIGKLSGKGMATVIRYAETSPSLAYRIGMEIEAAQDPKALENESAASKEEVKP